MASIINIFPNRTTNDLVQEFIGQYAAEVDLPDASRYVDGTTAYVQQVGWREVSGSSWIPAVGGVHTPPQVDSLAELKALTLARYNHIFLNAGGRSGTFVWDGSDLSTEVTNDPGEGVYVPSDSDTSGASGTWVRQYEHGVSVKWFGAVGDGVTDDTTALQNALNHGDPIVRVPEGSYVVTDQLDITTEGQHLLGEGGEFIAKTTNMENNYIVHVVETDLVSITGMRFDNPDELKSTSHQGAIKFQGNGGNIHNNTIRRCMMGIAIFYWDAPWRENRITNNYLYDMLGAAAEDRGDGIVSWGSNNIISGNIVKLKAGEDGRVGIHGENLGGSVTQSYPWTEHDIVIANNIVVGQYRRSFAVEDMHNAVISGNVGADATWWGIAATLGADDGAISITGNTIYWTRTSTDTQGDSWSPDRSGILIGTFTTFGRNISVAHNTIHVNATGDMPYGIYVTGDEMFNVVIDGNIIDNPNGGTIGQGIFSETPVFDLSITNNIVDTTSSYGIRAYQARKISMLGNRAINNGTNGLYLTNASQAAQIQGNYVEGGSGAGISIFHSTNVSIQGNVLRDVATGMDGFGTDWLIVADNIVRATGSAYANVRPANSMAWGNLPTLNPATPSQKHTVAGLPGAGGVNNGSILIVTDDVGGEVPAFSDGTNWRRVTDRAIVSVT